MSPIRFRITILTISLLAGSLASVSAQTPYTLKNPPLTTNWTYNVGTFPWQEYPRPQLVRDQWQNLNGIWQWEPASSLDAVNDPPFGKDLLQSILVPFPVESGLSGIMETAQYYSWYKTSFVTPSWKGSRTLLNFGAVDYEATVFINGHNVTFHRGGYFRFQVDITDYLASNGTNELLVFVFDPSDSGDNLIPLGKQTKSPSHIFYTATTGIWQTVFLEPAPTNYITRINLLADMTGQVNATVHSNSQTNFTIDVHSFDGVSTIAVAQGTTEIPTVFKVNNPSLWSPKYPTLYNITITLNGGDVVQTYTGFRTISKGTVDGVVRPLLNGDFVFGFATLDQGFWPDGIYTPPTPDAMRYDLQILKLLGFNKVRKHLKIEPDLYYRAADVMGIMIQQDMPSLSISHPLPNLTQQAEFDRELELMVSQHMSFPSIIAYTIYNEGWGQNGSLEIALTEVIKSIDPTRLIDAASGWNDHGAGDFSDNHRYASPQCGSPFYSTPSSPYDSSRIGIQGEFGGIGNNVPIDHLWNVKDAIDSINQTYELALDLPAWNYRALSVINELTQQTQMYSCSGGVYTQTTDVEGEVNGLLTYDRRLLRPDVSRWQAAISALYAAAANRTTPSLRDRAVHLDPPPTATFHYDRSNKHFGKVPAARSHV